MPGRRKRQQHSFSIWQRLNTSLIMRLMWPKPLHQLTCTVRSWWHHSAYNLQCKLRSCQSLTLSPEEHETQSKNIWWEVTSGDVWALWIFSWKVWRHYDYLVSLLHGAHLQFTDGLFGGVSQTPLLTWGQLHYDSGSLYKEGYRNVGRKPGKFIHNNSWQISREAEDLWLKTITDGLFSARLTEIRVISGSDD